MRKILLISIIGMLVFLIGSVLAVTFEQKVRVTVVLPVDTKIYSPIDGNYGSKRIPFNITTSEEVDKIEYIRKIKDIIYR